MQAGPSALQLGTSGAPAQHSMSTDATPTSSSRKRAHKAIKGLGTGLPSRPGPRPGTTKQLPSTSRPSRPSTEPHHPSSTAQTANGSTNAGEQDTVEVIPTTAEAPQTAAETLRLARGVQLPAPLAQPGSMFTPQSGSGQVAQEASFAELSQLMSQAGRSTDAGSTVAAARPQGFDPSTMMSQLMGQPGVGSGGSSGVMMDMVNRLMQSPGVQQLAEQMAGNQASGPASGPGATGGLDLGSMMQQMMPMVSQVRVQLHVTVACGKLGS